MKNAGLARSMVGWVLFGTLAVLLGLKLTWVGQHLSALRPVAGGDRAPALHLPLLRGGSFQLGGDEGASLDGEGAVTVIDFFATWCGPCRIELPHVDALWRRYQDRGVRFVAVDVEPPEAREFVEKLAKDLRLELPIALDGEDASAAYKVSNLPTIAIVGKDGRIRKMFLGLRSERDLADAIDAALDE